MIRKIEYTGIDGQRYSFAIDKVSGVINQNPIVNLHYLEDFRYLEDPANGYIENGHPTEKLLQFIKNIERINEGTFEYAITDVSRMDTRQIRSGRLTAIETEFDQSGDTSILITGIGDRKDCLIERIDTERKPDIMSKDLFIGNMSGFTIGFSSGITDEVAYAQVLNPVNANNVNNYYPVLNHGYLYDGALEYYCYGNKQTEILNPSFSRIDDQGNIIYQVSGIPNALSPIFMNMIYDDYANVVSSISISDYATYSKNSHRERIDFTGGANEFKDISHNLITNNPFVYVYEDDGTIGVPTSEVKSKNIVRVSTPYEEIHGYANIIRPNRNYRIFPVDITTGGVTINHSLNSTSIFVFMITNGELGFISNTIIDENHVQIPMLGIAGNVIIFDTTNYTTKFSYSSFSSGIINHNLDLRIPSQSEMYLDPWVFGIIQDDFLQDELVACHAVSIDENNIYVDFGSIQTNVDIYILDFWRLNEADALFENRFIINTDQFAFNETPFYGNEGVASPFHRIYPLASGLLNTIKVQEALLRCQIDYEAPQPLDFITGYYASGTTLIEPVFITTTNELIVPQSHSGTPILVYEKNKALANEFRFRGTDVSPVSWYNTDRIIAIQSYEHSVDNIYIFPDIQDINLTDAPTTPFTWGTGEKELISYGYNTAGGNPITSSKATIFTTDDAEVAKQNQDIMVSTKRRLYKKSRLEGQAYERIYDYSIEVVDNTNDLFSLSSGLIEQVSGQLGYIPSIRTQSIFDKITFQTPIVGVDIYDEDGYLFTPIAGQLSYLVPFVGAIYEDGFVHNAYRTTNVFGTAIVDLGFHNTERAKRINTLRITALPSGLSETSTDIMDSKVIHVHPITQDDSVGYDDSFENPNPFTNVFVVPLNNEVAVIPNISPTFSTSELIDRMYYTEASGIIGRTRASGIISIFDIEDNYILTLDVNSVPQMPSGVVSGYTAFASGMLVRYDSMDEPASILDRGEVYG